MVTEGNQISSGEDTTECTMSYYKVVHLEFTQLLTNACYLNKFNNLKINKFKETSTL